MREILAASTKTSGSEDFLAITVGAGVVRSGVGTFAVALAWLYTHG
jgi:uncharacterized membrane-anchored protein YitT (DUF2179 family)